MAVYTGSGGKVTTGAATDLDAISWSLESTIELHENTQLGATWKTYTTGLADWTASVEALALTETDPTSLIGTSATLKLYIDADNYFTSGDAGAICTGCVPTNTIDGPTKVSLTFEGTLGSASIAFT